MLENSCTAITSDHFEFLPPAGTSTAGAMAFFGSTATKDSLYEYTVKDAGKSHMAYSIRASLWSLQRYSGHVSLPNSVLTPIYVRSHVICNG